MSNSNQQPINIYFKLADEYIEKLRQKNAHIVTFLNLIFGLLSLMLSMNGLYRLSSIFILISAICDFFDGRNIRRSDINIQLHSLADMISFGVAPVILVHSIKYWSILLIIAFISFPATGAWRVARTNVNRSHDNLLGLPMSIAGTIIAFLALFSFVSPLIMIGLSILMISPIEIPKF